VLTITSDTTVDINGAVAFDGAITGATNITLSGELDAATLDISGNADIDGTLEADAITVDGTALATYIRDTVGTNMLSSNTESGITVTYDTSNDNIDFAVDAAQTGITSLFATDIKIGEDDETKIDFEDANTINFYANNAKEVVLAENSISPGTSDGTALGTTSLMWSDLFLASGSVINFNNGDITLTHSSNTLTAAGGTFAAAAITGTTIDASTDFTIGDTVITDGVITDSSGLALAANVTVTGNVLPNADDTYDLGSASAAWQDLFLEGDITFSDSATIATSAGNLNLHAASGADVIIGDTAANYLFVDGGSNHIAFGATASNNVQFGINFPAETYSPGSAGTSFFRFHVNQNNAVTVDTNNVSLFASVYLEEPNITVSGVTLATSATLYIAGAASEATNDYALFVDAGDVRIDGYLYIHDKGGEYIYGDGSYLYVIGGSGTVTKHLLPQSDDNYDLGSASAAWQDLFLEGDITFTDAGTIQTSAGNLTISAAAGADVTIGDDAVLFVVDGGNGHVGIGANSAVAYGFYVNPAAYTVSAASGGQTVVAKMAVDRQYAVTIDANAAYVVTSLYLREPNITEDGGTATVGATLYIEDAPTEGDNNYAIWVDDGDSRFDSDVQILDDKFLELGDGKDSKIMHSNSAISADAEVTDLIVGTSDHMAIAANSLIISNTTTDGDIAFLVSDGGNSEGAMIIKGDKGNVEFYNSVAATQTLDVFNAGTAGSNYLVIWNDSDSQIGSVSHANGNTTAYNTSSDYRIKENVVALSGAVTRVKTLKPYRFNFLKAPSVTQDGFFAHEVATVVPEAVTGAKDAVDADDRIIPQGMDHGKLVPLLTAAIQELDARVAALES